MIFDMLGCAHKERGAAGRVCTHLLERSELHYVQRFTGTGVTCDLFCDKCSQDTDAIASQLVEVCLECFRMVEQGGCCLRRIGTPEVLVGRSDLRFRHETFELAELGDAKILDVQPVEGSAGTWIACTSTGLLIAIDAVGRTARIVAQVPRDMVDFDHLHEQFWEWGKGPVCVLRVSRNGELAAVAERYREHGVVLDLSTGKVTMPLLRDEWHEKVSSFPVAFCELDGRVMIVHGTEWNRLDVSDARTGVLLTQRELPHSQGRIDPPPPHDLDYFHSQLSVSPGGKFVADNGWGWHPVGIPTVWSLPRWLHENAFESEDGESRKQLYFRAYFWDGPLCWIDDYRLALWGYGDDNEDLMPAVCIYDVRSGRLEQWFAGPKGSLAFDGHLFSFDPKEGTSVWDVDTGMMLVREPSLCPAGYHPGAKHFLTLLGDGRVQISWLERRRSTQE